MEPKRCRWLGLHFNQTCENTTQDIFCRKHSALYRNSNINVLYEKNNYNSKTVYFYDKSTNETLKYNYYRNSWLNVFDNEDINKLNFASNKFQRRKWIIMYLVCKHYMHGAAPDIWRNMIHYYIRR